MSTNFVSFESPQNKLSKCDLVILDTCTLINLASGDEDALNFTSFSIDNNITFCYTCKSVEELQILKQSSIIPKNKNEVRNNMNDYLKEGFKQSRAILDAINILPNVYPDAIGSIDGKMIDKITENSLKHNLRWGDAAIYTIAKENNINYIWSYDKDWTNVKDDDMTIITNSRFIFNNQTSLNTTINKNGYSSINKPYNNKLASNNG